MFCYAILAYNKKHDSSITNNEKTNFEIGKTGLPPPKTDIGNKDIRYVFFLIGIHSMHGLTATTRHGATRKRSTKRLKHTGNLFRKTLHVCKIQYRVQTKIRKTICEKICKIYTLKLHTKIIW